MMAVGQLQIYTHKLCYNTVHYNKVLDITWFKDGSQKCIDYIEQANSMNWHPPPNIIISRLLFTKNYKILATWNSYWETAPNRQNASDFNQLRGHNLRFTKWSPTKFVRAAPQYDNTDFIWRFMIFHTTITEIQLQTENKRSRRTCIAPLACIHMIFKQDIAGKSPPTNLFVNVCAGVMTKFL